MYKLSFWRLQPMAPHQQTLSLPQLPSWMEQMPTTLQWRLLKSIRATSSPHRCHHSAIISRQSVEYTKNPTTKNTGWFTRILTLLHRQGSIISNPRMVAVSFISTRNSTFVNWQPGKEGGSSSKSKRKGWSSEIQKHTLKMPTQSQKFFLEII